MPSFQNLFPDLSALASLMTVAPTPVPTMAACCASTPRRCCRSTSARAIVTRTLWDSRAVLKKRVRCRAYITLKPVPTVASASIPVRGSHAIPSFPALTISRATKTLYTTVASKRCAAVFVQKRRLSVATMLLRVTSASATRRLSSPANTASVVADLQPRSGACVWCGWAGCCEATGGRLSTRHFCLPARVS